MAAILVIDDLREHCVFLATLLRAAGHSVDTAHDGEEGVALCMDKRYDLVVTDIIMPRMDGIEVVERLGRMDPRPRAIVISGGTAYSLDINLPKALRLGAYAALAKPLTRAVFLSTVDAALGDPAPPTAPDSGGMPSTRAA